MGTKDNHGTLLKVIIGGPSFRVIGEVDAGQMLSQWKTEGVATSGATMFKMTRQVSEIESIDIACNQDEYVLISAASESFSDIEIGIVTTSGTLWTGLGRISCEQHSKATNKLPVKMMFTEKPTKVG